MVLCLTFLLQIARVSIYSLTVRISPNMMYLLGNRCLNSHIILDCCWILSSNEYVTAVSKTCVCASFPSFLRRKHHKDSLTIKVGFKRNTYGSGILFLRSHQTYLFGVKHVTFRVLNRALVLFVFCCFVRMFNRAPTQPSSLYHHLTLFACFFLQEECKTREEHADISVIDVSEF